MTTKFSSTRTRPAAAAAGTTWSTISFTSLILGFLRFLTVVFSTLFLEQVVLQVVVVVHGQQQVGGGNVTTSTRLFMLSTNAETLCPQLVADSRLALTGNFSSPVWPSPYPPDAVCYYRLQGVPWEGVKLTFLHFDLEPPYSSAGCLSDYLEITTIDIINEQRTFRGRYCGRSIPNPLIFLDPIVELAFRSNPAIHHSGFYGTYEFIDEAYITPPKLNATSPCGGVLTGIGGILESPGYPHGYSAGLDCLWLIRVPYQHAISIRVAELEFQGSIANCQKAQISMYDGYEYSLEETSVIKRFCGDLRYYKGEEDRSVLSIRNRLVIRYTTTEPSKPAMSESSSVGFRLIWSDVQFNSVANCTRMSRFPCQESRFCFTKNHTGGAASCPDLRHYCISNQLVCDSIQHCGEGDSSDERNCQRAPLIVMIVVVPLALLLLSVSLCFCFQRLRSSRSRNDVLSSHGGGGGHREKDGYSTSSSCCCLSNFCYWSGKKRKKKHHQQYGKQLRSNVSGISSSSSNPCFTKHELLYPPFHVNLAPIPRSPTPYIKHGPQHSPGASDIVSPASGFSDSESDVGSSINVNMGGGGGGGGGGGYHHHHHHSLHSHPHLLPPPPSYNFSCPTHGPFRFLIPPLPAVIEEYDYYYGTTNNDDEYLQSDTNTCADEEEEEEEEVGSTISSQNSDNQQALQQQPRQKGSSGGNGKEDEFHASKTTSPTDRWRAQQQQNHGGSGGAAPAKKIGFSSRRQIFQRSDALCWTDNDGKSSIGSSSPTSIHNICPRCSCSVDEQQLGSTGSAVVAGHEVVDESSSSERKHIQWGKNEQQRSDGGGMSGRLVGVPSLLRRAAASGTGSNQKLGSNTTCSSAGGAHGGVDSGIDTSIENVKVITSFDSSNNSIDNEFANVAGVGGWKSSGHHFNRSTSSAAADAEKSLNTCSDNKPSNTTTCSYGASKGSSSSSCRQAQQEQQQQQQSTISSKATDV